MIDFCFQPTNRQHKVVKNFLEFDTVQDCNAYKAGLKGSSTTSNDNYRYFDGFCFSMRDKKYVGLSTFKSFTKKSECDQEVQNRYKYITDAIISNETCNKRKFFTYQDKTILDCIFDVTDSTPFILNPSLKVRTQLAVVTVKPDSNNCVLALKNPSNQDDNRMILNCKFTPVGSHETNLNLNEGKVFKPQFNPSFFRYSDVTITIGDSKDKIVKSGVYIADAAFNLYF